MFLILLGLVSDHAPTGQWLYKYISLSTPLDNSSQSMKGARLVGYAQVLLLREQYRVGCYGSTLVLLSTVFVLLYTGALSSEASALAHRAMPTTIEYHVI
jgi:hypothetical protein